MEGSLHSGRSPSANSSRTFFSDGSHPVVASTSPTHPQQSPPQSTDRGSSFRSSKRPQIWHFIGRLWSVVWSVRMCFGIQVRACVSGRDQSNRQRDIPDDGPSRSRRAPLRLEHPRCRTRKLLKLGRWPLAATGEGPTLRRSSGTYPQGVDSRNHCRTCTRKNRYGHRPNPAASLGRSIHTRGAFGAWRNLRERFVS